MFALHDHSTITAAEPLLSSIRDGDDLRLLSDAPFSELHSDAGFMPIRPSRLDQQTADMTVSRSSDSASVFVIPARILARNEAQIGHESGSCRKASEVMQLGNHRQCRQRVNATEALERTNSFGISILPADFFETVIQRCDSSFLLFHGEQVIFEDETIGFTLEL